MTRVEGPAVVVGVDGSHGSRAALHHALGEAARRHTGVRAVVAYPPPHYGAELFALDPLPPVPDPGPGATARARGLVDEVVTARRAAAAPLPDVATEVVGVAGPPADVLVDTADGADSAGHRSPGTWRGPRASDRSGGSRLHPAEPLPGHGRTPG